MDPNLLDLSRLMERLRAEARSARLALDEAADEAAGQRAENARLRAAVSLRVGKAMALLEEGYPAGAVANELMLALGALEPGQGERTAIGPAAHVAAGPARDPLPGEEERLAERLLDGTLRIQGPPGLSDMVAEECRAWRERAVRAEAENAGLVAELIDLRALCREVETTMEDKLRRLRAGLGRSAAAAEAPA